IEHDFNRFFSEKISIAAGVRQFLARLTIGRRANSCYEIRPIILAANTCFFRSRTWRRRSFWGGHPADSSVPATEAIDDAFAEDAGGRGKIPGVGVPGSRTNPVSYDEISRRAHAIWEEEGR